MPTRTIPFVMSDLKRAVTTAQLREARQALAAGHMVTWTGRPAAIRRALQQLAAGRVVIDGPRPVNNTEARAAGRISRAHICHITAAPSA